MFLIFFLRIASESFYSFCNRQITHYVHELQCKLGFGGGLYPEFDVNFKIILSLWNKLSLKFCNWFGLKWPWHIRSVLLKRSCCGVFFFLLILLWDCGPIKNFLLDTPCKYVHMKFLIYVPENFTCNTTWKKLLLNVFSVNDSIINFAGFQTSAARNDVC